MCRCSCTTGEGNQTPLRSTTARTVTPGESTVMLPVHFLPVHVLKQSRELCELAANSRRANQLGWMTCGCDGTKSSG
jgi:hypothetical protein